MDLALALRTLVRVVDRGSLTGAARDLGISQPAVTRQLRRLEAHVGARLLDRSPRRVKPTLQGARLYEAGRAALASIDGALDALKLDMSRIEGPLRIHAPSCIGVRHLHPIVLDFQARHPDVAIDLVLENRTIDLVFENIDVAIRYGRPEEQELVIRRLGFVRRIVVASPDLVARHGPIGTPERLAELPIVTTAAALSPRNELVLQKQGRDRTVAIPVRGALRTNSAEVLVSTLLRGHALGPVQHLLVAEELAAGRLVRVLPDYEARPTEAFFVYPSARYMRPVVRLFTDLAVSRLKTVEGLVA